MLAGSGLDLIPIAGLALTVVALIAASIAYLGVRGQANSTLQAETISSLDIANKLKAEQIKTLDAQVLALTARANDLQEQLAALREAVTQAAKVDLLRAEVTDGIRAICARLDGLAPRS